MRCTLSKLLLRNSRYGVLLLSVTALFSLGGCAQSGKVFTDAGTNLVTEADVSQYLDLSALEEKPATEKEDVWNGYDIYTVTYGTSSKSLSVGRASVATVEATQVKAEFVTGSMTLVEMLVKRNDYVEKGDPIAKVLVETSAIDLEELELKLQRAEEDYAETTAEYLEQHEEDLANISVYYHPGRIDRIEYAQAELDFAQTCAKYEKQIESLKEQISDLKELASTTEILAPESGFILNLSTLMRGQELKNGEVLCYLSPTDKIMLEIPDDSWRYGYGMQFHMTVGDDKDNMQEYEVQAITPNARMLQDDWEQKTTMITGDYDMAELIGNNPYSLTGTTNVMENVLLVPEDAVTEENSRYFVTVLKDDGTLEKRQFIPGGQNSGYYWVFDGLEDGTRIIIE